MALVVAQAQVHEYIFDVELTPGNVLALSVVLPQNVGEMLDSAALSTVVWEGVHEHPSFQLTKEGDTYSLAGMGWYEAWDKPAADSGYLTVSLSIRDGVAKFKILEDEEEPPENLEEENKEPPEDLEDENKEPPVNAWTRASSSWSKVQQAAGEVVSFTHQAKQFYYRSKG